MRQTLMNKLHEYIVENNPDLLFELEEDRKVVEYLLDKITTVNSLIKQMEYGQPIYLTHIAVNQKIIQA